MAVKYVQVLRKPDEMDALSELWKSMEKIGGGPTLFQSWKWNRLWCRHVLETNSAFNLEVRLVEDSSGKPLAIIPLFSRRLLGPALRIVDFLGHRLSPCNDILLAEPGNMDLAGYVVHSFLDSRDMHSIFHLRNICAESAFGSVLMSQGMAEPQCNRVWITSQPEISHPVERLKKGMRKSLRRRKNALNRMGEVTFRVVPVDQVPMAFDELAALHLKRFASMKRSSLLYGNNLAFLRSAISSLAGSDVAEILELRLNDRTIASQLILLDQNHCYAYQAGFDPEFARYSPMWLLSIEAMHRAFTELQCESYELGQAYGDYKYNWEPEIGTNLFSCHGGANYFMNGITTLLRKGFRKYACQN